MNLLTTSSLLGVKAKLNKFSELSRESRDLSGESRDEIIVFFSKRESLV